MKKIFVMFIAGFAFISAKAQLENTTWKATLQFDSPTDVYCVFGKDTAKVYLSQDSSLLETMAYTFKDGVMTFKKIEGQSSCDDVVGTYNIAIKDDKLTYSLEDDDCDDRVSALDETEWTKAK
jgi:hypothetical protein